MAKQYYGGNKGDQQVAIQTGSADLGTDVEVVVNLASALDRHEVLILIDEIKAAIVQGNWPPA